MRMSKDVTPSATVYLIEGDTDHTLAVDCDVCHEGLLRAPVVAFGFGWLAQAVADHHATVCPGSPL